MGEIKASLVTAKYRFEPMTCREEALKTVVITRGTAALYRRDLKGAALERFNNDLREVNAGSRVAVGVKQVYQESRERIVVARALDAVVKAALRTAPDFRVYRVDPCAADLNPRLAELVHDVRGLGWCISAKLASTGVKKGQVMRAIEPCVPREETAVHALLLSYLSSGYFWAEGEGPGGDNRRVQRRELKEPTDYTLPSTVLGTTLHEAYFASVMEEANAWIADYVAKALVEHRLVPFEAQYACLVTFGDEVVLLTRFYHRESVEALWDALRTELTTRHALDTRSVKIRTLKDGLLFGGLNLQVPRSNSEYEHDGLVWRLPDYAMLLRHLVRDRVIHDRLTTVPVRHRDARKAYRNIKERQVRTLRYQERYKVLFPGRNLPKKGVRQKYRALHMTFLVSASVVSIVRYYNVRLRRLAQLHAHCHDQCLPELNDIYWLIRKSCHKTLCAKFKCNTVGILLDVLREKAIEVNLITYKHLEALRQEIQQKERLAHGLDVLPPPSTLPPAPQLLDMGKRPALVDEGRDIHRKLPSVRGKEAGELVVDDDFFDEASEPELEDDFYGDEASFENVSNSLDESRRIVTKSSMDSV
jgi:hypothetical protein